VRERLRLAGTVAGLLRLHGIPPGDPARGAAEVPAHARRAAVLVRLRGIGPNDALLLGAGLLYRDFHNWRELAGMAGLAPVPWPGGAVDRDQGTGVSCLS